MPDHKEHAEAAFLPGIQQYRAEVWNSSQYTVWDMWAHTVDEAKDQAHEKAKKAGIKFDHIMVVPA